MAAWHLARQRSPRDRHIAICIGKICHIQQEADFRLLQAYDVAYGFPRLTHTFTDLGDAAETPPPKVVIEKRKYCCLMRATAIIGLVRKDCQRGVSQ